MQQSLQPFGGWAGFGSFRRGPEIWQFQYPLVNIETTIENGHRNSGFTMDLPIKHGDFPYVSLPEGITLPQSIIQT